MVADARTLPSDRIPGSAYRRERPASAAAAIATLRSCTRDSASNDALITPSTRRRLMARIRAGPAVSRVEICTKKHCKKKGSLKMLRIFEALAPDGVEVLTADMSHTEYGCFDECMMGPNVRVDGAGPKADGGPIVNGVQGAAGAAEVLGVDVPEGWELPPAN